MKRMICLLLAIIMVIGTLAACNNEQPQVSTKPNDVPSTTQGQEEIPTETQAPALEEKTIQIWLAGPGKQKDSEEVWAKFNELLQQYVPNTTVEFTVMPNAEYKERFSQMLASGEDVDLAWNANWVTGLSFAALAKDENIIPLDDLVAEYGQDIIKSLSQETLDAHKTRGALYHIISWQGLLAGKHSFIVPTELAELAGPNWVEETQAIVTKCFNNPWNAEDHQAVFDQLDKYLAAVKDAGKLYSGFDPQYVVGWYTDRFLTEMLTITQSVGIQRHDDSFTVVDSIQTEAFALVAKNMADFYKKGYLRSDIASWDRNSVAFVKDGEYTANTLVLDSKATLTEGGKMTLELQAGLDCEFIEIESSGRFGNGNSTAMVIPYCADEPERAMMVLNALYAHADLYQLLVYGIEGVHYTKNADGTIVTPYGATPTSESDYGIEKWRIGTCANSLATQNDDPNYYNELVELEKTTYYSPFQLAGGFSWSKSQEATDITTALKAIDGEYYEMLVRGYTGDDWETMLNKWIAERKAAGVDTLVAEYQEVLDAFCETHNIKGW